MVKKYLKRVFYNKDIELIDDKTERFIVLLNDIKQGFGAWYSIVALRVIPVLLFIFPVNIVFLHVYYFYEIHFMPDYTLPGAVLDVIFLALMAVLVVLVILVPKVATIYEFGFGLAYLFLVFKHHFYNTPLGIALLICVTLYLLIKLFFLVVKIIAKVKFSHDEKGVERDETGRIIRATKEDVLFIDSKDAAKNDSDRPAAEADRDFLFDKTSEDTSDAEAAAARMAYDDDFFFDKVEDTPAENENVAYNEDVFFVKEDKKPKIDKNATISENDNDYFFG